MSSFFFGYALSLNGLGFFLMFYDKEKAKRNKHRVAETTLWAIALLGGGAGSWLGMKLFRHKTKHSTFKFGLPILTILQLSLLFIFLLP